MRFLRPTLGVLTVAVAIVSGVMSIVREILNLVDPAKFPERSLFFASLRVAFFIAVGVLWWQEKRARIVAETLLDKSKPDFELDVGDLVWHYRPSDDLTAFYLLASIVNKGEPSVSLNWKARYVLNGAKEPMEIMQISTPHILKVAKKQVTFTNENLTNLKTLEFPVQKGQFVGGRILCAVPGDRVEQIRAAQYNIEVECTDYTGKKSVARYRPSPAPPKSLIQHYAEKTQPLPAESDDAEGHVSG